VGDTRLTDNETDFASLRHRWGYMNICWNDVDFAIILGVLVAGPCAKEKLKLLFDAFLNLRIQQALKPRGQIGEKGFRTCWCVAAMGFVVTFATAGLAMPVTAPIIMGSCATGMGFSAAGSVINGRDAAMWNKRVAACRELHARFPQLDSILSTDQGR
jgi:hypothetical protein